MKITDELIINSYVNTFADLNGNTYFSSLTEINGVFCSKIEEMYGYGSHAQQMILKDLSTRGLILPVNYHMNTNIKIMTYESEGLKRQLKDYNHVELEDIKEIIKNTCIVHKMNQKQLAEYLEVTQKTVGLWKRNNMIPVKYRTILSKHNLIL